MTKADGKRDAHPARAGPDPAGAAARRAGPATWARIGFAAMCVGALIGYFAFPTYPTYDSFYALLWGRDLLHLHLPDFSVYRGSDRAPAGDRLRRCSARSSARAARG